MSEVLSKMIEALGLEVAVIKNRGGGIQAELRNGECFGRAEGSWLYRFILTEDLNLRDDTPVRITVGQKDVEGTIVSFRDGVLVVTLDEDLGPKIAAAKLIANNAFLIERLKERLEKVRSGEAQLNRSAAERVLGLADPQTDEADPHPSVTRDGRLNTDQIRAVRHSLGSDTTYVWGPPGTGKTTALARIVEAHYRAGRSVLLVSNTNIAVDTALERVAERLKGEPKFHEGLVIRKGPVVKEELRKNFGSQVVLEEIVERLGGSLRLEKEALTQKTESLITEERSALTALKNLEQLTQMRVKSDACEKSLRAARSDITTRRKETEYQRDKAARFSKDLERARTMGAIRRFFHGLYPKGLEREIAKAKWAAQSAEAAAGALAEDIHKLETENATLRSGIDRLGQKTRQYPPVSEIKSKLDALHTRLGQIKERIAVIDRESAELEQHVLSQCRILATTIYRTYLGKNEQHRFDVVVIDEASMLMPPLVYYAAGLATRSITVAGDFRQLPPIVISKEKLAKEWLKRDVFEIAGIPQRIERNEPAPHLVALGTQYRMCEPICEVINDLFYADKPLHSDPIVNRIERSFPLKPDPLIYVNTEAFHPWTVYRIGAYSRYNLFHALLLRNIVLHLDKTGFLPPEGRPNDAVGIVTPYAAQASLIQTLLNDRLGGRAAGIAATVHRFQGNEKSVMMLDLTDSAGTPLSRFLRATRIEEDGARLLNVAASRAKQNIVLIGNFDYLQKKAPKGSFVMRLIDHFEKHGEALDPDELLPLAGQGRLDGLSGELPATFDLPDGAPGAFTEKSFYPAFSQDLARARESVVIFSPFATSNGTGRWTDAFRSAIDRGVCVRILTRPSGNSGSDSPVHLLRKFGVSVDLRARMHEKIAVLDGHILWHGSLNILSHSNTHESMLRIESRAACDRVGRFVSTQAGRGNEAPSLATPENPACPKCRGHTVWNSGRYGIWFECEDPGCDGKVNAPQRGRNRRGAKAKAGRTGRKTNSGRGCKGEARTGRPCPSPGCGGQLVKRRGRYGTFLGCSNYPACDYTESMK